MSKTNLKPGSKQRDGTGVVDMGFYKLPPHLRFYTYWDDEKKKWALTETGKRVKKMLEIQKGHISSRLKDFKKHDN